ncbi:aminotransferase class III-fold pyridoxal phosphate-dependent enzyme [Stieleria sp. TO1_6]|uniref:aminotransferase class III-fold pyridoxal phosphate-dependent enzyme n=1 Tax=Stieleria tagensis TaxID=2956795 RepID=UPI00209B9DF2|nr:aminotransferase class III-fold pyridoxal phosphate-dependent enzyme [Stieleria tagensis]MCO8124116.1 aminotransferase class III-fold pyridoxal phosphate-dependent enzyme [Stieleria tagensis]
MSQTANESTELVADALRNDPRIAEAKRLIRDAMQDHGSRLEIRPSSDALRASFAASIDRLTAVRGGDPIWPYLSSGIGRGPYVELADGSVKLDFICGIGVHGAGHSDPGIVDAAIDAAIEDTVMQGNLQQNPASIEIMEQLIGLAQRHGASLEHCLLSTSGAMANENALKIAMHHVSTTQNTLADRVIAFDNAFAGRSLAMAALSDRPSYRTGLPLIIPVDYLPFRDPADPEQSQRKAVDELHRLLKRHPGRYAAFWAEPIAGEGGYYPGSTEFFTELCEPLKQAGIPIIFDEIQSFSRTSRPFAFQHYGLDSFADIVTVGKVTQVCATLYSSAMKPTGPILSQTFTGSTSSIATGIEMLRRLDQADCFGDSGQNNQRADYFATELERLSQKYPDLVRGPFGEGMMVAFTPGDGSFEFAKKLMMRLFDIGLLVFVCGGGPTRIRFLPPPATTTTDHIDHAIELLDQGLASIG